MYNVKGNIVLKRNIVHGLKGYLHMDIKKICAALCACVVCLCAAGCSKDSKDSSSATESKSNVSTADNADSAKSEDSKGDESDADSKVLNEQGELIKKLLRSLTVTTL